MDAGITSDRLTKGLENTRSQQAFHKCTKWDFSNNKWSSSETERGLPYGRLLS